MTDSGQVSQSGLQPVTSSGISLSTTLTQLTNRQVLVTFTLLNNRTTPTELRLGCGADLLIGPNDGPAGITLGGGTSFRVLDKLSSSGHQFEFIGRNLQVITDVTRCWYGQLGDVDSNWYTQIEAWVVRNADLGMAFS
jgi:hypothetical protein